MSERYGRNKPLISGEEQALLKSCTAAIAGLGGLGGTVAEQMVRLGFGKLILIDSDVVEESNLNRQLFAVESSVGKAKTLAARQRLSAVNQKTVLEAHAARIDEKNAVKLLGGADIVIDALDNITSRKIIRDACKVLEVPMVHGAVGGWCGQVCFIPPGGDALDRLYPDGGARAGTEPAVVPAPAFTAAVVASLQVAQAVKWRLGKGGLLTGRVLYIDLLTQEFDVLALQ